MPAIKPSLLQIVLKMTTNELLKKKVFTSSSSEASDEGFQIGLPEVPEGKHHKK